MKGSIFRKKIIKKDVLHNGRTLLSSFYKHFTSSEHLPHTIYFLETVPGRKMSNNYVLSTLQNINLLFNMKTNLKKEKIISLYLSNIIYFII